MKTVVEPFFVDDVLLSELEQSFRSARKTIQDALDVWRNIVGEDVSLDELRTIAKNPEAYYRAKKVEANINANAPATAALISEGFSVETIRSMQKLPDGFESVVATCAAVSTSGIDWRQFEVVDGKVQLAHSASEGIKAAAGRAYFYAQTADQVARLEFARAIVKALSDGKELFKAQLAKCARADKAKDAAAIAAQSFHLDLPVYVRLRLVNKVATLEPNPEWVVNGWRNYASDVNTTAIRETPKDPAGGNLPEHEVKKYRILFGRDGSRIVCEAASFDATDIKRAQLDGLTIDPSPYVLDDTGRLVPATQVRDRGVVGGYYQ